jgi:drug/metabolite transporter (DMT)-like permease
VPYLFSDLDWQAISLTAWTGLIYMGTVVTILGDILWYYALGKGGIERVGLFQFFQPVVGVLCAALLLGETLSPWLLAAAALILGGVYIATRAPRHIVASAARTK